MIKYPEIALDLKNENVTTIFLSIDENKDSWLTAIPKTKTAQFEHYIIKKGTPLYNFFDIKSIPRYVLIDENGKIKAFEVPRPRVQSEKWGI